MDLTGAVALVTGGAGALGRTIAQAYLAQGAKVVLVDLSADDLRSAVSALEKAGRQVIGVPADVTKPEQVEVMVHQATGFGPVDILVNCAGTLTAIGPVWEVDPDKWLRDVMVSLYGSFLCCRAIVRPMIERRLGYILNFFGGGTTPQAYMTGYVSAKAALLLFTECLAKEVSEYGVKVFAVRPEPIRTGLNESLISGPEGAKWRPDFRRIFDEGKAASPGRIADLAIALVSGKADALSGRLFHAEGDFDEVIANEAAILERDLRTLRVRE